MEDTEHVAASSEKPQIFNGMTFYMRPCSVRSNIRKLLDVHGGTFAKEANGGVIILTDSLTHNSGYHIDLVHDSIDKNKLQDIDKYKLPSYNLKYVVNNTNIKVPLLQINKARQRYIPEEDAAIFKYITKYGSQDGEIGSTGGNLLWKEMERKSITLHTWQSMKNRYFNHIQHYPPKFKFEPLEMDRCSGDIIHCLPKVSSSHNVHNNKLQEGVDIPQAATSSEGQNNIIVSNLQPNRLNNKKQREKYSNTNQSTYQENVTISDDSDDFDVNLINEAEKSFNLTPGNNFISQNTTFNNNEDGPILLNEAEKSFHLTPGNPFTSQNSTFNSNEDGPIFCECYEKYDYNKVVDTLKLIDVPVDDHIWTSISNQFIIEDISLKYGISSDEVVQILEMHKNDT